MHRAQNDQYGEGVSETHLMDDSTLLADLRSAIDHGELEAWYQPQIDVETGRIVAVEALCRWNHPTEGLLYPQSFIPLADGTELIVEIGRFMLEEACQSAAEWHAAGIGVEIAVNVSATQLAVPAFFDDVATIVTRARIQPDILTIEITESREILDVDSAIQRLSHLRSLGVGVSIDDFGTGFSSLEQLANLPATEVKLDQTLVQAEPAAAKSGLEVVIAIARDQGIRVVAEGIETQEQLDLVRELRVARAQGYLIGGAAPKGVIQQLLSEQ